MVKNPCNAGDVSSIPSRVTKASHAVEQWQIPHDAEVKALTCHQEDLTQQILKKKETQNPRPLPDLLNQNLHFNQAPGDSCVQQRFEKALSQILY